MKHRSLIAIALVLLMGLCLLQLALSAWLGAEEPALLGSEHVDMWGTHWFYWMFEERLLRGEPFAHTELLFHPWGKDVYLHTGGNIADAMLALPFRWLLGDTEGYNVFIAAILICNGLGGAWLARKLGATALASTCVGGFAAMNPYALAELGEGRLTQAILVFPTLFIAEWFLLLQAPSRVRVLKTSAWLALTGLVYWYYALFCGALAGIMALLQIREVRRGAEPVPWRAILAVGGISFIVVLPLAWPMLSALSTGTVPGLLDLDQWSLVSWEPVTREGFAMGLQAFDPMSLSTGTWFREGGELRFLSPTRTVALSFLSLALIGVLRAPPRWRLTLCIGALFLLLIAMGPALGPDLTNPFYILLVKACPPLQRLWWPGRALGILSIWLLPPLGWALSSLGATYKTTLISLVGLGLLGFELSRAELSPMPISELDIPDVVACLAEGEGAIFDLPYGDRPERLLHQTVHGRARMGGMLESNPVFVPEEHARHLQEDTAMRALVGVADGQRLCGEQGPIGPNCLTRPSSEEIQALGDLGFSLVVVDRKGLGGPSGSGAQLDAERRARLELRELLGNPVFMDSGTVVYLPWGGSFECERP